MGPLIENRIPAANALFRVTSNPAVREFVGNPLFWGALAVKVVAGTLFASTFLRDYFAPFVNYFVESGLSNPWEFFAARGETRQFPYPPVMLYLMALPRAALGFLLPPGWDSLTVATLFVYRLPLLAADLAIGLLLAYWFPQRVRLVLLMYWCSPLAFYITYWHGQLDVLPTAIFLLSLVFLRRKQLLPFAVTFGAALATKSHLWVALPFVGVYLARRQGTRDMVGALTLTVLSAVLLQLPWLFSRAYLQMVFGSEEQQRVFALSVPLGDDGVKLIVAPIVLAVLWLRFQSYPKTNWDLFLAYLSIVFGVFVLLAPPRPGYFLWSLPFIVCHYGRQGRRQLVSFHLYGIACLAFFLAAPQSDLLDALGLLDPSLQNQSPHPALVRWAGGATNVENLRNLAFAAMFACMSSILLAMYLVGVRNNRIHRMRTRPLLIGIAGDSGAGKDTVCRLLESALGSTRCTTISGDDYHRWPRGHHMWTVHTHLDVRANDLARQRNHAVAIARGEGVSKGTYDHGTGTFTPAEWIDPSNYVIFAGLHTLALESQRNLYELTVFINPDEPLRRNWKVRRDHAERGYAPAEVLRKMEEREPDRLKFILPQEEHAEVVVTFRSRTPLEPDYLSGDLDLDLEITGNNGFTWGPLAEALSRVPTLVVEHDGFLSTTRQRLSIRGTVEATIVRGIAQQLIGGLDELTDAPAFDRDLNGCLQLVLLTCLADKFGWKDVAATTGERVR